jgi:hypothetical protein
MEVIAMPLTFETRLAVNGPVKQEENEHAAIAACAASLDHYQITGLHTTLDELKEWTQSVRKDRRVQMPVCHR